MEFRRIKKEILTEEVVEGEVGKEETNSDVMNSYEAQEEVRDGAVEYREAILRAAQSESSAIEEYETILKLEEQTDEEIKNLFHDMIIHIRDEEKAHFQMLAEGLSKFPGFDVEEELEKAKQDEEIAESATLTEDVMSTRTYNVWDIDKAVQKYVTLSDEAYDQISDFFYRSDDEISAEEAQSMIDQIAKILRLSDDVIVLILSGNYTEDDLDMNTGEKYNTAVGLSSVSMEHFEKVREFVKRLGPEICATFETLWAHGIEERLEKIQEIKLSERTK